MSNKPFLRLIVLTLILGIFGCAKQSIPSSSTETTFYHPPVLYGGMQEVVDQIETLNREIPKDPENENLYMQRAIAYKTLIMGQTVSSLSASPGDYDFVSEWTAQARADFDMALSLDPNDARLYFERATLSGGNIESIADLTAAIEIYSENGEYYLYRGLNYLDVKQYDNAITDFNAALQFTSDKSKHADILYWRAKTYVAQGKEGDITRALRDYEEVIQAMPNFIQAVEERDALLNSTLPL